MGEEEGLVTNGHLGAVRSRVALGRGGDASEDPGLRKEQGWARCLG